MCSAAWAASPYCCRLSLMMITGTKVYPYMIRIFIKESANMRKVNELLGDSFYRYLSNLPDLVLIMDESHHYRAERGAQALNDLYPLLGLELTAPPCNKRCKTSPFQKCGIRISAVQGH